MPQQGRDSPLGLMSKMSSAQGYVLQWGDVGSLWGTPGQRSLHVGCKQRAVGPGSTRPSHSSESPQAVCEGDSGAGDLVPGQPLGSQP